MWWVVIALLVGCGGPPPLPRLAPDAVVLAFGDSLTFGTGARPYESYPAVLERLIGRTVVNAGVPGEVSGEGLRRLPKVVSRESPDLVILIHGGNDFLRRFDRADTARNLRDMIDYLREQDIPVVLVGVPEFGLFLTTADLYGEIADDMEVPLEDDVLSDLLRDNRFKSDHIHPNAAGDARMAEAVQTLLIEAGAL